MPPFSPDRLLAILRSWGMPGRYLVGYSGGGDSQVLLALLAELHSRLGAPLLALHVDHGLQPQAPAWTLHCQRSCERLGVPLSVVEVRVACRPGESLEAVARAVRYRALAGLMQAGDLLLTAHHQDDQAETLLLQLLRGSGVEGLAAMPALAAFPPGRLGRPLLDFPRESLRAYAKAAGHDWVEDPSNRDVARDRNFLRHRVLPLLRERWPACGQTLARSAGHCAEARHLIEQMTGSEIEGCAGAVPGSLSIERLCVLDEPRRRAVLRGWIAERGFLRPDVKHLERVLREVLPARADRNPLVRWPGCEIRRYRHQLFALAPLPPRPQVILPWSEETLCLPDGLGVLRAVPGDGPGIDPPCWWQMPKQVVFRPAERACRPLGQVHHRPLKKLYQERGVPAWLRPYVPLVLVGGELVAVADLCLCQSRWATARGGIGLRWEGHPWPGFW